MHLYPSLSTDAGLIAICGAESCAVSGTSYVRLLGMMSEDTSCTDRSAAAAAAEPASVGTVASIGVCCMATGKMAIPTRIRRSCGAAIARWLSRWLRELHAVLWRRRLDSLRCFKSLSGALWRRKMSFSRTHLCTFVLINLRLSCAVRTTTKGKWKRTVFKVLQRNC